MEVDKMYSSYEGVLAYTIHETGKHDPISTDSLNLRVVYDPQGLTVFLYKEDNGKENSQTVANYYITTYFDLIVPSIIICNAGPTDPAAEDTSLRLFETVVERSSPPIKIGRTGFILPTETEAIFLKMPSEQGKTYNY